MRLMQIKQVQIKFPLSGFWTVWQGQFLQSACYVKWKQETKRQKEDGSNK
jgi:hypothetical protein